MAGDIKRQRKSWTLQDRSKVSINILRANLAEEGDEDAQLDVAKRLLQENSGSGVPEQTKNENARLALYWLIKSSEQGNEEATELLRECLQSGRGLTAQNILDVRTCVTTPRCEKMTFKAARLLHRKLSNGEEFITTTQLLARVKMNRRNVTFEEQSNGDVLHEEMHAGDEDNNPEQYRAQQEQREEKENSTDSGTGGSTPEQNEPIPTPHPLLKDIGLNETFIVSSQRNRSIPSNSPPFVPTSSSTPKEQNVSRETGSFAAAHQKANVQSADLKLAMTQSGKKLTLQDLLTVAKDFNYGRATEVSVDERNRILGRHKWEVGSFLNLFLSQLLFLGVVGKVLQIRDALTYFVLVGMIWSAYNLYLWKLRYENFKDWKRAFESVLAEESWESVKFKQRLTQRYMTPYLVILTVGLTLLSFFKTSTDNDLFAVLIMAVGILAMISIQFGVLCRILPTWQQIIIVSSSLIYYRSSIVTRLLGHRIEEQTKFLHEPLISVGGGAEDFPYNLSLYVTIFSVLICTCLLTSVKLTLDRILCETIPEVVLTLCLVKFLSESVECEIAELQAGICLAACFLMALLASKMKLWKVITGLGIIIVCGLILMETFSFQTDSATMSQREMKFLDWEEYDSSCHRKAWSVQSPAATQIKCSSLYADDSRNPTMVKWKGRISVVKVEKLSRSFITSKVEDVVFDISVGIFTGGNKEDGGRNWQSFLSGSSDNGEVVAPASLIVHTRGARKRQDLIDHILNLRSGDQIEFVGRLKGSTAGGLKPQIVDVLNMQCVKCSAADYGDFVVRDLGKLDLSWGWHTFSFKKADDIMKNADDILLNYKDVVIGIFEELKRVLGVS